MDTHFKGKRNKRNKRGDWAIFHLPHAAPALAHGHAGFDRAVYTNGAGLKTGDCCHYLHHRYFECSHGGDGPVNLGSRAAQKAAEGGMASNA